MTETEPYHYVRFCWWKAHNLKKLVEELRTQFSVVKLPKPEEKEADLSLSRKVRGVVEVKADTLSAFLSAYRAVLSQKEKAPFTESDRQLRKTVLALYPHARPTPFPWEFSEEPKFEIEKPK